MDRLRLVRRAPASLELDSAQVALPAREGELDDVLALELVDAPNKLAPERDRLAPVDVGVVGNDQPAWVDRRVGGDDRPTPPRANLRSQLIWVCVPLPS
jgi:hypothetical protein